MVLNLPFSVILPTQRQIRGCQCFLAQAAAAAESKSAEDITFVFVNQGESLQHIHAFMSEHGFDLKNVWQDPSNALGQTTGAHAMPTTLYYNADGQLVSTHFGELSRATLQEGLSRIR